MKFTDEELLDRVVDHWDGRAVLCLCCGGEMRILCTQVDVVEDGRDLYTIDEVQFGCTACDQVEYFRPDGYHGSAIGARLYPYDSVMRPAMLAQYKRWWLIEGTAADNARFVAGLMTRAVRDENLRARRALVETLHAAPWWRRAVHHTRRWFGQVPEIKE